MSEAKSGIFLVYVGSRYLLIKPLSDQLMRAFREK